jgi:hypothetical protein
MMKKNLIGLSQGKGLYLIKKDTNRFLFRRYQDFYLLEQKLTEFHGIFSDARLPPRRSGTTARSLEFLESIKDDFEHFLRVNFFIPPSNVYLIFI